MTYNSPANVVSMRPTTIFGSATMLRRERSFMLRWVQRTLDSQALLLQTSFVIHTKEQRKKISVFSSCVLSRDSLVFDMQ